MKEEIKRFICGLRTDAFQRNLPVMREETATLLEKTVNEFSPEEILEIGTCVGVSGLTVLNNCNGKLTSIENDESKYAEAKLNFSKCGFKERINLILGDCNQILQYLRGNKYDMAILDGPKSSLQTQYEYALEMLSEGGKIFIDDIDYHGYIKSESAPHKQRTIILALRKFIRDLKSDKRVKVTFYDIEDGVAIAEKI